MRIAVWGEDDLRGYQYHKQLPWKIKSYQNYLTSLLKDQILVCDYDTFIQLPIHFGICKRIYLYNCPEGYQFTNQILQLKSPSYVKQLRKDLIILGDLEFMKVMLPKCNLLLRSHIHGNYVADSYADELNFNRFKPVHKEDFIEFETYVYQKENSD